MARDSYLDGLANVPLFSSMSRRDLQKIAKASDELDVLSGKVLVEQGKRGREAFVVLEGSGIVKRNGRKVASLGPGDHFGELALLDGEGRERLRISRQAMDEIGSKDDFSGEDKFKDAINNKIYYGPVYFRRGTEPFIDQCGEDVRR